MLRTAKERNLYDAFKVKINWSEEKPWLYSADGREN